MHLSTDVLDNRNSRWKARTGWYSLLFFGLAAVFSGLYFMVYLPHVVENECIIPMMYPNLHVVPLVMPGVVDKLRSEALPKLSTQPVVYDATEVKLRLFGTSEFAYKYRLLRYGEKTVNNDVFDVNFKRKVVLFIPGNSGHFSQVRSLASVGSKKSKSFQTLLDDDLIDFYTVDFNEELSAFSGELLTHQATFVNDCIEMLLSMYDSDRLVFAQSEEFDQDEFEEMKSAKSAAQIIIVGHSYGGVVARYLPFLPNYNHFYDNVISVVGVSSPVVHPVVTHDPKLNSIMRNINAFYSDLTNLTLAFNSRSFSLIDPKTGKSPRSTSKLVETLHSISPESLSQYIKLCQKNSTDDSCINAINRMSEKLPIVGENEDPSETLAGLMRSVFINVNVGVRDVLVPEHLTRQDGSHLLQISTSTQDIARLGRLSTDHLAGIWCEQFINLLAKTLYDVATPDAYANANVNNREGAHTVVEIPRARDHPDADPEAFWTTAFNGGEVLPFEPESKAFVALDQNSEVSKLINKLCFDKNIFGVDDQCASAMQNHYVQNPTNFHLVRRYLAFKRGLGGTGDLQTKSLGGLFGNIFEFLCEKSEDFKVRFQSIDSKYLTSFPVVNFCLILWKSYFAGFAPALWMAVTLMALLVLIKSKTEDPNQEISSSALFNPSIWFKLFLLDSKFLVLIVAGLALDSGFSTDLSNLPLLATKVCIQVFELLVVVLNFSGMIYFFYLFTNLLFFIHDTLFQPLISKLVSQVPQFISKNIFWGVVITLCSLPSYFYFDLISNLQVMSLIQADSTMIQQFTLQCFHLALASLTLFVCVFVFLFTNFHSYKLLSMIYSTVVLGSVPKLVQLLGNYRSLENDMEIIRNVFQLQHTKVPGVGTIHFLGGNLRAARIMHDIVFEEHSTQMLSSIFPSIHLKTDLLPILLLLPVLFHLVLIIQKQHLDQTFHVEEEETCKSIGEWSKAKLPQRVVLPQESTSKTAQDSTSNLKEKGKKSKTKSAFYVEGEVVKVTELLNSHLKRLERSDGDDKSAEVVILSDTEYLEHPKAVELSGGEKVQLDSLSVDSDSGSATCSGGKEAVPLFKDEGKFRWVTYRKVEITISRKTDMLEIAALQKALNFICVAGANLFMILILVGELRADLVSVCASAVGVVFLTLTLQFGDQTSKERLITKVEYENNN